MFPSDTIIPTDKHYDTLHRIMANSVMSIMLHSDIINHAKDHPNIYREVARINKSLKLREEIHGEDIDFVMHAVGFLAENFSQMYEIPEQIDIQEQAGV